MSKEKVKRVFVTYVGKNLHVFFGFKLHLMHFKNVCFNLLLDNVDCEINKLSKRKTILFEKQKRCYSWQQFLTQS